MLTFSGMALDRAALLRRDPAWVAERLDDPTSYVVGASAAGVLLGDREPPALLRRSLRPRLGPGPELDGVEPVLLGLEGRMPLFAVDLDALAPPARAHFTQGARIAGMREAGAVLSRAEGGLAAYAAALVNWHRRHGHCANCGARTVSLEGGYSRRCPECAAIHFPRTDPVVIVLVECDGRLLLGRQEIWPARQYSVLAGFVSPGESAEEAVTREVEEESGIRVHGPAFVTSQPWPFPSSLMLGFEARSDGGDPIAKDGELEDVRWFSREDVGAALAGNGAELRLPPSVSIARFLVERWWEGGPARAAGPAARP